MKKIKNFNLVVLFFLLSGSSLFSQASLCFKNSPITLAQDTLNYPGEYLVSMTMTVHNDGAETYDGEVLIKAMYNANVGVFTLGTKMVTLAPGDSVEIEVTDDVNMKPYKGGPNLIVIWPRAASFPNDPTCDSAQVTVVLQNFVSKTPNIDLSSVLSIGPNPVSSQLFVSNKDLSNPITSINIFSTLGQKVYSGPISDGFVNFEKVRGGTYFLEVLFKNGQRGMKKIVKI